ncbi:ABC transporter ATP-binding protein/permease [bacterium]|nr:ABC transporter ATP-binding protein/permease [bacterium]MDD5919618.1 ABC transporter ATP-binding protein [bacterium]
MKTVLRYLKPQYARLALQLTIKFIGTITELFIPWMLSHILDDIVPLRDMVQVYLWGALMLLAAAVALFGNVCANRMSTRISRRFTEKLRHDAFARVSYLSSRQVDGFTLSSLISRLTSDTYNVHQMVDRMQRLGVRAPILLLGGICVTFTLEPVLTLVLVCTLPLLGVVVFGVSRRGVPLYVRVQEAVDGMVRKVQENMTGVRVIKALSKTEYEKERFDEVNREVVRRDQHAGAVMATTNPVMSLLLNLGLTAVVVVGAFRVNAGVSKAGKIIAFLSYFTIILNAMMMISRLFMIYSKGAASAKRIEEVLETPVEPVPGDPAPRTSEYHVEFQNVSFSYNKAEGKTRDDLSGVSFALRRGQTLGIIGPTGSGKSTIVSLLMRFYDVDAGEIRIGGRRIEGIPEEELHTMFGVVFQNDFILADSIRENIDFGRGLSDETLLLAAKLAQAEFIEEKEGGLSHMLTAKGANLSGGQKQRLLIARALAGKPEILVLDDASSALDYKTDQALRSALHHNFSDTTTIIIAQRISSILNADHILVLDGGRVIGAGTHEELLASCADYREIYEVQMGEAE